MSTSVLRGRASGYTVEFSLQTEDGPQILLASNPDGVAAAMATIISADLIQIPVALVRDRARQSPGNLPDHGLKIIADAAAEIGALAYFGPGGADYGPGAWVTYSDTELHPEVKLHRDQASPGIFPPDSHIPLDLLARAVEDFRDSGGMRPGNVSWRPSTNW